ncbi:MULTISPECIES: cupin-like domain-containing protein [Asticcacaulis]|uniref:cupin-like domain-containing protein n=1 Tax=Asticcacaulis TaxID=76890 RepID=UPI001AEAAF39|nr:MULTISPECIES: cupin-like domain-containing protein [Asticcacaulis]
MHPFPSVESCSDVVPAGLSAAIKGRDRPMIFKGLVRDWPIVQAALSGNGALIDYLKARDNGKPPETFRQAPGGDGKYFYGEDAKSFNFARAHVPLRMTLDRLLGLSGQAGAERIYVQSAPLSDYLPAVKTENALPGIAAEPRIWIGNRSTTQIHFDLYDNLACMVAGSKRFVLFPPEQLPNLYMGPFEATVSGVPTAMANLENPDFEKHPRFAEALKTATVAELEPGDVLFVPYMWWHHVVSDDDLNVQINYWWNYAPQEMGVPIQALFHAMLSLRDLPAQQNRAWKAMFDHFVFHQSDPVGEHLPAEVRGFQGELTPEQRAAFRKQIGKNLSED